MNQFFRRLTQSPRALIPQPIPVKSKNTPINQRTLNKDNKNLLIVQHIYKYMRKILDLLEQDEDNVELNDYEKILALNKKKINPYDVEFVDSQGNDYSNIIEVKQDGIYFNFDGLEEFLRFFFPDVFGDEGSDGWYEAGYLDSMYRGNWDFDFWGRSSDDWEEGIIVENLKGESINILYEIIKNYQPTLLDNFFVNVNGGVTFKDADYGNISDTLELMSSDIKNELQSAFVKGSEAATYGELQKYIEGKYCNGLLPIGIENFSNRSCFWKYHLSWGPAIMLFVRYGTTEDKLLDLMFTAIKSEFNNHASELYEIQYEVWDETQFRNIFNTETEYALSELLSNLNSDENEDVGIYMFLKTIDEINKVVGFKVWKPLPDSKYQIYIDSVDRETLKINYIIREKGTYFTKKGITTIDSVFNLFNVPSLFNPMEYRNH